MMIRPAIMLPNASRVMGAVTAWSFSFAGVIEGVRVNPVWISKVMRRV